MKKNINQNIIYYASSINNRGGGASRSPRNFIKSLIHLGYNVTIISNSIKDDIINKKTILYHLQNKIKYYQGKYSIKGKSIDNRNDNIFIFILKLIKYITITNT